ncbi:MAG: hypothetical protein LDL30_06075 [Desulfovibrio sp.]|nr:hypothetical protein [Desulfovibrio sp.]
MLCRGFVDKAPVKVAVRLYPNGRVTFHYGSGNAHIGRHPGRDKTIGISLKEQGKGMHLGLHNDLSRLGSAQTLQFTPVGLRSTPWLSPLLMQ